MIDKDSEFLLWIAKRLVYKYKENSDIITIVDSIIKKYCMEKSSYEDIFKQTNTEIEKIIRDLSETNQKFTDKFNTAKEQLIQFDILNKNNIFESINFDKIFRS